MSKKLQQVLASVVVLSVLVAVLALVPTQKQILAEVGGQIIKVDVARTEAEQNKGLSGRPSMAEDEGMLFVFAHPGRHPFWMKDMNFPIDIIWLMPADDGDHSILTVVFIKHDARPESYPEIIDPEMNAQYVLEIASGVAKKNNLKVGDSIFVTY